MTQSWYKFISASDGLYFFSKLLTGHDYKASPPPCTPILIDAFNKNLFNQYDTFYFSKIAMKVWYYLCKYGVCVCHLLSLTQSPPKPFSNQQRSCMSMRLAEEY